MKVQWCKSGWDAVSYIDGNPFDPNTVSGIVFLYPADDQPIDNEITIMAQLYKTFPQNEIDKMNHLTCFIRELFTGNFDIIGKPNYETKDFERYQVNVSKNSFNEFLLSQSLRGELLDPK